jgi:hypothetical protein
VHGQQHLNAARRLRDRVEEGRAFGRMAECYSSLNQHGQALEHAARYMSVAQELDDKGDQAMASWVCVCLSLCLCMV